MLREFLGEDMLLLPHPIEIVDYDPRWPAMFVNERDLIAQTLQACGGLMLIEHVGSTSVPGLGAKPIIDLMVGAESLAIVNARWIEPMRSIGYEYIAKYEVDLPERRYFRKPGGEGIKRMRHVHVVEPTSRFWSRHIAFRDALRQNRRKALAYEALKRDLARQHQNDIGSYTDAKTEFIESVVAEFESGASN